MVGPAEFRPRIDVDAVQRALHLRSRYLAERVHWALDLDGKGFETIEAFHRAAEKMLAAPVDEKVRFFCRAHDHDGQGRIERDELERMLHLGIAEHRLDLDDEQARRMVDSLMSAVDEDADDALSYEELQKFAAERPELRDSLVGYGVGMLVPGTRGDADDDESPGERWTSERVVVAVALAVFVVLNVGAFLEAFLRYRAAGANIWIQIARGSAGAIHIDAALILVPMLRHFLTWLRRRPVARWLPLDDSISAHRLLGETLMGLSIVHGIAHVFNVATTDLPWSTLVTGAWLTGWLLMFAFVGLWWFSRARVRTKGEFELFHSTHMLFLPFFGLAVVHGPVLWIWVVVPLLAYLIERIHRARVSMPTADVLAATALPAGVVRLDLRRPPDFDYVPGDYAFLLVPAIARHEWHPFTITSAPQQREVVTFHIRALGNWTKTLRKLAGSGESPEPMVAHIDGPYGAPASHLEETEHVIAIAAGIGVTPFASLLRSILMRKTEEDLAIRKLHFVWISREADSFSWFADLLWRLEAQDADEILDTHIYMTQGRDDIGGVFELARQLDHEQHETDLVTGLAARTNFGRPDLEALVADFCKTPDLPPPVVYFCGPQVLARQLRRICASRGLTFREERF